MGLLSQIRITKPVTLQDAAHANGNGTSIDLEGYASALVQISGTFTGTVTFEACTEETAVNWIAIQAKNCNSGAMVASATAAGIFEIATAGLKWLRCPVAWSSGTSVTVIARRTPAQISQVSVVTLGAGTQNVGDVDIASIAAGDNNIGNVDLASAIPAGTNVIGKVDDNPASAIVAATVATVTTAGTRVQLPSAVAKSGVMVIAQPGNTGYIYIGGSTVSSTVYGAALAASGGVVLSVANANLLYIDASVNGEGVSYFVI